MEENAASSYKYSHINELVRKSVPLIFFSLLDALTKMLTSLTSMMTPPPITSPVSAPSDETWQLGPNAYPSDAGGLLLIVERGNMHRIRMSQGKGIKIRPELEQRRALPIQ